MIFEKIERFLWNRAVFFFHDFYTILHFDELYRMRCFEFLILFWLKILKLTLVFFTIFYLNFFKILKISNLIRRYETYPDRFLKFSQKSINFQAVFNPWSKPSYHSPMWDLFLGLWIVWLRLDQKIVCLRHLSVPLITLTIMVYSTKPKKSHGRIYRSLVWNT
jgi:hypothetical protein